MVSLSEFTEKFTSALEKDHSIVFNARCEINYSGRAESHLPMGDRTILIKSDKTLIVHQPTGSTPVNYLKEQGVHEVSEHEKGVLLQSRNANLKEYLDIVIGKVYFFHNQTLEDAEKIQILGTEKHMAEHIMENPSVIDDDFKPLSREEHTKFGFIDVFGHDNNNTLVVVECKRYVGDPSAVTQLRRYVEKIKAAKGIEHVRGILACPRITKNAKDMLHEWGFEHVSVNPPKYMERFDAKQQKLV